MRTYSARIVAKTVEKLKELSGWELDLKGRAARKEGVDRFIVPGILTDEQIERVKKAGYAVEDLTDLSGIARERVKEVSKINRFAEIRAIVDFAERDILGYMTVDEVEAALANLHTLHPDLVTLMVLPHKTWENRTSHAVHLRAGKKSDRPGVLFTGSVHAREWGGSDICVNFLVSIIHAYRSNSPLVFGNRAFTASQVQTILENLDLFVFPDVNPDGKNYSQNHDFWWRKNRNPNTAVDPAHPGVDLNRNYDFLWSSGIGTSSFASSEVYKGQAPFSEPETRNVRWLLDSYPNITHFVDIHSYSELILYSWGDDNNQNADPTQNFQNPAYDGQRGGPNYDEFISTLDENTLKNLGKRMFNALKAVRGKDYTLQQAVGLYPTTATSDDYALARHIVTGVKNKVYAFTIEFGTEFVPPFSEMKNIIKDIGAAMTELCWAVSSDVYFRDNLADTGAVPTASPFWDSPDIWVRNLKDGGTVHQNTIRGQDNFIYVRVTNRGLAEAEELKARVYIANFAGTEFVHPYDWVPRNPSGGGSLADVGSYLIGETTIASLAAGASQTTHVRWPASLIPPDSSWHPCLLVEISPNDGIALKGKHVWESNALAQKNITIVNAKAGKIVHFPFLFGNDHKTAQFGEIIVKRVAASKQVEIHLDIQEEEMMQHMSNRLALAQNKRLMTGFKRVRVEGRPMFRLTGLRQGRLYLPLKPRERRRMALRVRVPDSALPGAHFELYVIQNQRGRKIAGGVTLKIEVVE
jgi:murein tripeptide amidase MpaA